MGTLRPGTSVYSAALALSQLINQYTHLNMIVQPYPTQMAIFPHVKAGTVQVSYCPVENLEAYAYGIPTLSNPEDKAAHPQLRLLMGGYHLYIGWITRPDTGIKTISDLKGHRIFWKSSAAFANAVYAEDSLRAYGLDPDKDVNSVVGYENLPAAYKALQTKKIDALFGVIGGAQMEELEAATGVAVLPFGEDKVKALRIPTKKIVSLPAKYLPGVKEPMKLLARQEILFCSKEMSDEAAYLIVKTIVEHHRDMGNIMELKEWGKEYAMPALSSIVIPFHPGIVKYFKEIGLWTPQVEAHNKEVLDKIQKVTP